jgi:prolyl oligopeptidase
VTQHPSLFRAVVSAVGIYDMLRTELDPNGVFNTTEYGSVKDLQQFRAFFAYAPLHHVDDGTKYPAVLFLTGDNDGRVNPAHSRKMTARDERIEEQADMYAFLFDQLGMTLHSLESARD